MQNTPALVLHNYVLQHKIEVKQIRYSPQIVYLTSFVQTAEQ